MRRVAVKLTLSFLLVIVLVTAITGGVAIEVIGDRVVAEAESKVEADLSSAGAIYEGRLGDIYDVVRFTSARFFLRDALEAGDPGLAVDELGNTWMRERLDYLSLTDADGVVLLRTTDPEAVGDIRASDQLVAAVLGSELPVAGTRIVTGDALRAECPRTDNQAQCGFAAPSTVTSGEGSGMVLEAAAPVFDYNGDLAGVLYGGLVLNERHDVVDSIGNTVFQEEEYGGRLVGVAVIYQGPVGISTDLADENDTRAVGIEASGEIVDRVVENGETWVGRAQLLGVWYISAYGPITDIDGNVIGMLGVGTLEQPYSDLMRRSSLLVMVIAAGGMAMVMGLSLFMSRRITVPVRRLVSASRKVAAGEFTTQVTVTSSGELAELGHAFNSMALALHERMEQINQIAKSHIEESDRLAVIGQLAADVAHELNNPLQGVVAYSHLLLERTPPDDEETRSFIDQIVSQANRCTTIIRALLDFARPRTPQKRPVDVNAVLGECLMLVGGQAMFHNIEIAKRLDPELRQIVADPAQLQQVFVNLLINAAEAMDGQGRLRLETRNKPVAGEVEVLFSDTGHGIAEEDLERIFDPFFSTKEAVRGTGLGLAISYGIVREHHGSITVHSEVGSGTTFVVRLPVAEADSAGVSVEG
jgi:two-component system NtrC family sensor kinase